MKQCSYCGRENEDTAGACAECGTCMPTAEPAVEPQLSDASSVLVVVRTFDSSTEASLLAARLAAAGIEACILESDTQPFSNVVPLDYATVRVAAKDREAAEVIAAEMSKAMEVSASAGLSDFSGKAFRFLPPSSRPLLAGRTAVAISVVIVVAPIIFGFVVHSIRETAAMGPLFWLWALFSLCCFFWVRYAFRRFRFLAWGCLAIGTLQVIIFSCLFWTVDLPVNAKSQPYAPAHNNNPHNW